eukprot:gene235-1097_t
MSVETPAKSVSSPNQGILPQSNSNQGLVAGSMMAQPPVGDSNNVPIPGPTVMPQAQLPNLQAQPMGNQQMTVEQFQMQQQQFYQLQYQQQLQQMQYQQQLQQQQQQAKASAPAPVSKAQTQPTAHVPRFHLCILKAENIESDVLKEADCYTQIQAGAGQFDCQDVTKPAGVELMHLTSESVVSFMIRKRSDKSLVWHTVLRLHDAQQYVGKLQRYDVFHGPLGLFSNDTPLCNGEDKAAADSVFNASRSMGEADPSCPRLYIRCRYTRPGPPTQMEKEYLIRKGAQYFGQIVQMNAENKRLDQLLGFTMAKESQGQQRVFSTDREGIKSPTKAAQSASGSAPDASEKKALASGYLLPEVSGTPPSKKDSEPKSDEKEMQERAKEIQQEIANEIGGTPIAVSSVGAVERRESEGKKFVQAETPKRDSSEREIEIANERAAEQPPASPSASPEKKENIMDSPDVTEESTNHATPRVEPVSEIESPVKVAESVENVEVVEDEKREEEKEPEQETEQETDKKNETEVTEGKGEEEEDGSDKFESPEKFESPDKQEDKSSEFESPEKVDEEEGDDEDDDDDDFGGETIQEAPVISKMQASPQPGGDQEEVPTPQDSTEESTVEDKVEQPDQLEDKDNEETEEIESPQRSMERVAEKETDDDVVKISPDGASSHAVPVVHINLHGLKDLTKSAAVDDKEIEAKEDVAKLRKDLEKAKVEAALWNTQVTDKIKENQNLEEKVKTLTVKLDKVRASAPNTPDMEAAKGPHPATESLNEMVALGLIPIAHDSSPKTTISDHVARYIGSHKNAGPEYNQKFFSTLVSLLRPDIALSEEAGRQLADFYQQRGVLTELPKVMGAMGLPMMVPVPQMHPNKAREGKDPFGSVIYFGSQTSLGGKEAARRNACFPTAAPTFPNLSTENEKLIREHLNNPTGIEMLHACSNADRRNRSFPKFLPQIPRDPNFMARSQDAPVVIKTNLQQRQLMCLLDKRALNLRNDP